MGLEWMQAMNGKRCSCGKIHRCEIRVETGSGAIKKLSGAVRDLGGSKVYMISDGNTFHAAGQQSRALLESAGIEVVSCCLACQIPLEPDEKAVGAAVMHFDSDCDVIVGVGSGVVNDIGKIISHMTGKPYLIVATAPSMDGYASATSSMTRDGLKISLPSRHADVIIGDTDILCAAPLEMMQAGLGDMIAKYTSICEWRLANLITGEYYCEEVAQLIRNAVASCVNHAEGLLRRDPVSVQAVFEGLVIGGVAMNYAGVSRPASGVEHYISHVLDMRGAAFGIPVALHGLQCAVGTRIAVDLFEKLQRITPDREKALAAVRQFDYASWSIVLRQLLGGAAESMIALEKTEGKYEFQRHAERLEKILDNWDVIIQIIQEELPAAGQLESLLDTVQIPKALAQIGAEESMLPVIFAATKDIRDKYVLSRLCWDLGILEEIMQ